ncbi:MAG TPA: transglycosylase family protein [Conexibacter sp.]|jgi:peptidoglycan hydrolase-like protein with peptidoglycan-binding domain|nr:transglycosylase family protein [Conexibacter sp.]
MSTRLALVPALVLACVLAAPANADAGVLKRGSRGPVVVQLQEKLGVPADGVFGPQTGHAVRRFQAQKGLTVDGVVGSQTAQALGIDLAEVHTASGRSRSVSVPPVLDQIAQCESGGNPHAISSDGTYRGKYQFDRQTWHAMGGHGDPAHASESEQDRRALALYRARGTSPWPACGA